MDFAKALHLLEAHLEAEGADWALIGGLALAVHGAGRLTHDVDIATETRVQGTLVDFLEAAGYETLHRSKGFSNHVHADPELGRIDVAYVDSSTAQQLFGDAHEAEILGGVVAKVARPEHLVAMKVLAAKNDPGRRLQEMADVVALLRASGLDAQSVRAYFESNDLLDAWEQIRDSL